MNEEKAIPNLRTLRRDMAEMSDDELDLLISDIRADRRRLVTDRGKVKRKGTRVKKKKEQLNAMDLMSPEEKADFKKFLLEERDRIDGHSGT